ncbi:MAG TPA: hypothetical protein VIX15_02080 [Streptosporangiaceae bacterium]
MRDGFEDLDLERLRRRRSEKWQAFPPDVLPAFVAEMDYDLAGPVKAALRSAIDLDDCGYANPAGVGESFARFAAARHGWTVDPGTVDPGMGTPGAGHVRVTIGTSSTLLADIVDRMAAAVEGP